MSDLYRKAMIVLVSLPFLPGIVGALYGQVTTGTILGVARDATGAVLPGVSITLTHVETGQTRTTLTDDSGRYMASSLQLGIYEAQAELPGFQTLVQSGIKLTLGEQVALDFVLRPGDISERITVTAEAALVDTTSSSIGKLIDDKQIRDLPLNGRDFVQLAMLQSGVFATRMTRAYDAHRGSGTPISVNGARVDQNLFLQDGTTTNDFFGMTPGGVGGDSLGVETIREFRVLSHNFSAEYGQAGGAIIHAVTKSGTNELHGTVFEFLRNSALDARNFFDRGADPPPFRKNQFGGVFGGPIRRDRTFFFGSYEGLRERLAVTQNLAVPSLAARQGQLPTGVVQVNPVVVPFLNLFPLPTAGGRDFGDGRAEFIRAISQPTDQNQFAVKVDHHFSANDSMFVRYLFDDSSNRRFNTNPGFQILSSVRRQVVTIQETKILSPKLLNVFRFGYNRANTGQINDGPLVRNFDPALSLVQGWPMGSLIITGGFASVGASAASDLWRVTNSFEYTDDVSYTSGRHAIKTGILWRRIQANGFGGIRGVGGLTFANLRQFLLGVPLRLETLMPGSDLIRGWRQNVIGLYVQDDFKYRPNLTLNLGLRYEFITVPVEVNGKISNMIDPFSPDAVSQKVDRYFNNPSLKNFGPRVGFAWDMFGNGKTSLRGGGGIFFDQFGTKVIFTSGWTGLPFSARINVPNPPFPSGFEQRDLTELLRQVEDGPIPQNFTNAYLMQYNLTLQHALTPTTSMEIGYVGSLGRHLSRIQSTNINQFQILPDGRKFFPPGATRPNRNVNIIGMKAFDTNSSFNSLQVTLRRRFSAGMQFQASYSFSKSLDESPGQNGGSSGGITTTMDPYDRKRDRARSPFDIRNNLSMNYTYDIPVGSQLAGIAGKLISGWQLGGIITVADGSPAHLNLGRSPAFQPSRSGNFNGPDGNTDRPDLLPGKSSNPVIQNFDPAVRYWDPGSFAVQTSGFFGNLGRNPATLPGIATFDLSLVKQTTLSEKTMLHFRAEFFNLLNRANFSTPDLQVFNARGVNATFGRITATSTTSRQIQFGLKLSF